MDITKFPDAPNEIIKHMDFLPDDPKARFNFLMGFVLLSLIEIS